MVTKIQLTDIILDTFECVKDKYNRIANGVNQGRAVYHDSDNKLFAKSLYILNKLPKTARAASLWKMDDHNHIFGNVYKYTESQRKEINKFKFTVFPIYV